MAKGPVAEPPAVRLAPLLSLRIEVAGVSVVGGPPGAGRRISTISGGSFEGDRLRGTVVSGGADWQTERGDGAILLDVRIVILTDDGASIAMTYTGIRHGPAEVMARMASGEAVDPASYYLRIVASFATSDPRYEWLNRILAVGSGHRTAAGPVYHLQEIL